MPYLETERTPAARRRVMSRAQLPLIFATLSVFAGVLIGEPSLLDSVLARAGFVVIGAATLLAVFIPWERAATELWITMIPVADVVGVALLHAALVDDVPLVRLLAIFPVTWLAYGFRTWTIVLSAIATIAVSAAPWLINQTIPRGTLAWLDALLFPIILITLALGVAYAARQLARSRHRAERATERMRLAHEDVRNSETVSTAILDSIGSGVLMFSPGGRLIRSNAVGRELALMGGLDLSNPGAGGARVLAPDRQTHVPPGDGPVSRAFRGDFATEELVWIGDEQEMRALQLTTRPVTSEAGAPLGIILAANDVTRLAEAIDVREQFLIAVSHELRTPLTSILGYLEVAQEAREDDDDETVDHSLAIVERNASQLLVRIGELLSVNAKRMRLERDQVDLSVICAEVVEEIQPRAEEASLTLRFDGEAGPILAQVDGGRIRQVLENLIGNSIKFTMPGGDIGVGVRKDGPDVVLWVYDSGVGMTADERRQAFDRFYRAAHAHAHAVQGIGLGLSLVRLIVEAHGGTMTLAPRDGGGTIATARIPKNPADAHFADEKL